MHVHILGICGTFMAGIAAIAKQAGHRVTGSDRNVYPPMSTQLEALGIELTEGFAPSQLDPEPDVVVVGQRDEPCGMPVVEALLDRGIPLPPARSGWRAVLPIAGCWRSPARMARPRPRACSPGSWSSRASRPAS